MTIEPGLLLTAGALAIGGVVWLVRLEGRVNLADSKFADLKTDLEEIKKDVKSLLIKP